MDAGTSELVERHWLSWAYSGVDPSIPGNGGDECMALIPSVQKILETVVLVAVAVIQISYAWPKLNITDAIPSVTSSETTGRRFLLMTMCLIFGTEIGFKLASRQMIWILNQCHVVTILQIFLLVAPPSKWVTAIFRIQMHCLNGATIAILFPILNTRSMPFEIETYYIQHVMMLVIPAYLIRQRGVYTPEPLSDYSWVYLTIGILLIYHWIPLQGLALLSHVNLNNMLCPAVSDPFHSRWYRIAAAGHQTLLILIHGKAYVYLCSLLSGDSTSQLTPNETETASRLPAEPDMRDMQMNGWTKSRVSAGRQNINSFEDPLIAAIDANGFAKLD